MSSVEVCSYVCLVTDLRPPSLSVLVSVNFCAAIREALNHKLDLQTPAAAAQLTPAPSPPPLARQQQHHNHNHSDAGGVGRGRKKISPTFVGTKSSAPARPFSSGSSSTSSSFHSQ